MWSMYCHGCISLKLSVYLDKIFLHWSFCWLIKWIARNTGLEGFWKYNFHILQSHYFEFEMRIWLSSGSELHKITFRFMLTRQQVLYGLERVELRSTSIFDSCPLKSRTGRQEVGLTKRCCYIYLWVDLMETTDILKRIGVWYLIL